MGDVMRVPPVKLDITLADLLKADDPDGVLETICQIKPNSDPQYGKAVPFSDKYIIHSAQVDNGDDLAHLQLEDCCYVLNFYMGSMDIIFIASEGGTDDPSLHKESIDKNAQKSVSVIQESQRPRIKTFANVEDAILNHDGSKIRWAFAMDFAERLPYFLHPEVTYELNSKRWLGLHEHLKSANDNVLDCQIKCPSHRQKTPQHKEEWYYGGEDCHKCTAGVEAEIHRILTILQKRPAPWVLKLTQSLSSVGTMIAKDEDEKKQIIEDITEYLNKYLPRITKFNAHLYTTTLILSDLIPGDTEALNFYIRKDGSPVFLGACQQLSTGESGRQATAIVYADQEKLERKYAASLEKIGKALHGHSYYGPVGADIMEDEEGRQYTIDLNVRTPLSLVLFCLKSHFTSRGYGMAMVYECIQLSISREELEDKFAKEFSEARIVLEGSTRFGEQKKWAFGVIIAGEDKKALDDLSERILKYEAGVADV